MSAARDAVDALLALRGDALAKALNQFPTGRLATLHATMVASLVVEASAKGLTEDEAEEGVGWLISAIEAELDRRFPKP